jgi:hypothetical protein
LGSINETLQLGPRRDIQKAAEAKSRGFDASLAETMNTAFVVSYDNRLFDGSRVEGDRQPLEEGLRSADRGAGHDLHE